MVIVAVRLRLGLPGARSLKDKRRILKSIMTRLRNEFNLSIAEIGSNDAWRQSELGLAIVANDTAYGHRVIDKVVRKIELNQDILLTDVQTETY